VPISRRRAEQKERTIELISHGKEVKVFAGNSNVALANAICDKLSKKLGNCEVSSFADGEVSLALGEPVRGADVFIVQSTCKPVNDNLMELLVMIDAMRRASAGRITAVVPYFGYARQDRKAKSRDPISAKLVANLITEAGADRVLTMDLHAAQIQGFFDIPVDNLFGSPILANYYTKKFGRGNDDYMVVSPDVGSVARARGFSQKLDMNLAIVDKRRQKANSSEVMNIIGDVKGKNVILLDDMVDTAGSLCHAVDALVEIGGAKDIYACATHGVLSGPALERIERSPLKELILLDTVPYPSDKPVCDKVRYLSVAPIFAEAIERIYEEVSISSLFD
jgi:ribose-phosphate pyrophosphokinase